MRCARPSSVATGRRWLTPSHAIDQELDAIDEALGQLGPGDDRGRWLMMINDWVRRR